MRENISSTRPLWLAAAAISFLLLAGILLYAPARTLAASSAEKAHPVSLVQGLKDPWSLAFLPDGRMLITEKVGRLRVIERGKLLPDAITGTPKVANSGQGGLLDIVLHPQYDTNGWLYLSYSAAGAGGTGTEVVRARLQGNQLVDQQLIFRQTPKIKSTRHFGSRLVFDRAGYLYITLGDRGEQQRAQKMDQHIGKAIRLHDDGSLPKDNPYAGKGTALAETYSYGHRNMQGAAIHPDTGAIWTHEHGPQGGDEINILHAGTNYGWPIITYGVNYVTGTKIGEGTHKEGMAQPLYKWVPSIGPSGMAFYTGDAYPGWQGSLFVGSLKFQTLVRLTLEGERVTREERLFDNIGRVRDVRQGPDGLLYLLADDKLLQLQPAS